MPDSSSVIANVGALVWIFGFTETMRKVLGKLTLVAVSIPTMVLSHAFELSLFE